MKVEYNSQRDNFNFAGKFKAWSQCFSTSSWMLISYWLKQPCTDAGLREYVEAVELQVGNGRIAKRVLVWAKWITGFTSLWWLVQKEAIAEYLAKIPGKVVFRENDGTWDEVSSALKQGPIIIGTSGLPGLRGGHIILIVGETTDGLQWIVHDPFGDATGAYTNANGESVLYPKEWFKRFTENVTGRPGKIRIMYFIK